MMHPSNIRYPDFPVFSATRDRLLKHYIEHAFMLNMEVTEDGIPEEIKGYKAVFEVDKNYSEVSPGDTLIISFQKWKDSRKWAVMRKYQPLKKGESE